MAVFSGTSILNTGGTGADQPATSPILTAPASGANVVGFAFTNPGTTAITVNLYRNSVTSTPIATQVVPALAGVGSVPIVQLTLPLTLAGGETIFAQSTNLGGIVNVEIDGTFGGQVSQGITTNQLLLALILQNNDLGANIPDVNMLNNGYTFT